MQTMFQRNILLPSSGLNVPPKFWYVPSSPLGVRTQTNPHKSLMRKKGNKLQYVARRN
jgi:hypothetical protein